MIREPDILRVGSLTLGETPRVVAAIDDGVSVEAGREAVAAGVDLLELRIDQFSSSDPEQVVAVVKRFAGIPLLATIRMAGEGGAWQGTEAERLALYLEVLPHVDAVDVELAAKEVLPAVLEAAHTAGKPLIGSHHNFQATPSAERLAGIVNDGKLLGADVVKVAATCQSLQDLRVLAKFTLEHAPKRVVVIGMGPYGKGSRVFFPALGSLLTYTFLGEAKAPGQLTCTETIQYLKSFYPDFGLAGQEGEPLTP